MSLRLKIPPAYRSAKLLLALFIFLSIISNFCCAEESAQAFLPHLKLELIAESDKYIPGQNFSVAIKAQPEEGWHIYWKYPGDSGSTLKTDWSSSFGANIVGPQFPLPKRIALGPLVNFGYDSETFFLFEAKPQSSQSVVINLRVDTEWLVCKEECIPANAILSLKVNPRDDQFDSSNRAYNSSLSKQFVRAQSLLPFDYPSVQLSAEQSGRKINIKGKIPANKKSTKLEFFPLDSLIIRNAAPQKQILKDQQFSLELEKHSGSKVLNLRGVLVSSLGWTPDSTSPQGINVDLSLTAAEEGIISDQKSEKLLFMLMLAFVGGLILNLMPCVFPILTLKIFSLLSRKKNQEESLHRHSVFFAIGVISTFLILALAIVAARASGEAIGWGFQLQSPGFVACLSLLTLIVSLNFLGVFEFGASLQKIAGKIDNNKKHGENIRYFFDGVLITILATPCTAPFMGSALAYGLSASTLELLAVFTALALGMAAPFVLLSYSQTLRAMLPKPGPWMETLKCILAFPLLGTTIWLLWVLGLQAGVDIQSRQLVILLIAAFTLWLYGRYNTPLSGRKVRILWILITFVGLIATFYQSAKASSNQSISNIEWEPFSMQRIAELRNENRIIYVDFTAAWCITCQVNKLVALNSSEVISKFKELGVVALEADWTNRNAEISSALSEFGRDGVPLNVVYPSDPEKSAQVLPQILTPSIVIEALEQARK